ncbi:serine/threonine-protein kinase [Aldersonia kunmingensis]|uniref:serine/threonine-protein kinase n=1 Tax=Aldersonia kunmingensis TaxID=408066 RepID=UPI0008312991|nr:serine/threonine-protein kinase [Aldersonia kunmingensis]
MSEGSSAQPEPTQDGLASGIVAELGAEGFDDPVVVGSGGFGTIYRCRQPMLDRVVAIKVLTEDPGELERTRFLREQQAMGRLSGHPNIMHVLQAGVTFTGRPYIVMPFHPEDSLEARIQSTGALPVSEVLDLGIMMSGALETAHQAGVLHRDVKPANILITEYGAPQLTDFGIARVSGDLHEAHGLIVGSPAYIAPELVEGRPASVASDVYGLGATLFTALNGEAAFARRQGEAVVAQLLRISTEALPDLRGRGVPDEFSTLIEQAMARSPEERPHSAAAFGAALRDAGIRLRLSVADMPLRSQPQNGAGDGREGDERRTAGTAYLRRPTAREVSLPPTVTGKYRPPIHVNATVPRTRLLDQLERSHRQRLVLIHGPAGFGKSTLAAQQTEALSREGVASVWLTIDDDDDTPAWFLEHLLEAIGFEYPSIAQGLARELETHGDDLEHYVLVTLINRLHLADQELVVVIDDWHRVTNQATRAVLDYLLVRGCDHLRFIVTSRNRLGLPLNKLLLRREMTEIDSTALRFDLAESQELLADTTEFHLGEADVATLEESTDGWAAALQLALLTLRDHPDPHSLIQRMAGRTRAIDEYLGENVLDNLEPELLDFVTATSVTERICGSLARALTGHSGSQALLEEVESRDLFLTRMDQDGEWFRYHHLFAELLCRRMERNDPDRIIELHRIAAQWFVQHRDLRSAVGHHLSAGDATAAVDNVEQHAITMLEKSQLSDLLGLAAKLPDQLAARRPGLQIALAWTHSILRHPRAAADALALADNAINDLTVEGEIADRRAEVSMVQSSIDFFDDRVDRLDEAIDRCTARTDSLGPLVICGASVLASFRAIHRFDFDDARRWQRWAQPYYARTTGRFGAIYGACMEAIAYREQLDIAAAEECLRDALNMAISVGDEHAYSGRLASALIGDVRYEQGHISEADRYLNESLLLGAEGGGVDFMLATYATGARVKVLLDQPDAAAHRLDEGQRLAQKFGLQRLQARIDNERIRTGIGSAGGAIRQPEGFDADLDGIARLTLELVEDGEIRTLLATNTVAAHQAAYERARSLADSISETIRTRAALYARLLVVECLARMGDTEQAERTLGPLLDQCAHAGLMRPPLDAGPSVSALVQQSRPEWGLAN